MNGNNIYLFLVSASAYAIQTAARRTELYRLAVCPAIGLGLGWFARPTTPKPGSTNTIPQPVVVAPTVTAEPRSTFWSVARLTASQRPSAASSTSRGTPVFACPSDHLLARDNILTCPFDRRCSPR